MHGEPKTPTYPLPSIAPLRSTITTATHISLSTKLCLCVTIVLLLVGSYLASRPAYVQTYETVVQILEPRARTKPFSPLIAEQFSDFTIVTFSSSAYTDCIDNLIGSLHVWAHGVKIVVYDIGLTAAAVARLQRIPHVKVVPFLFSDYPPHVKFLYTYAFKPLLWLDAYQRFGNILVLDAGIEVRSNLYHIFARIRASGYFFVEASSADPMSRVHPTTVKILNTSFIFHKDQLMCYAGMHGYLASSPVAKQVLERTAACAANPVCIDPSGSGHNNHRYEQSVSSIIIRNLGLFCHYGRFYSENVPIIPHPNPLRPLQPIVFFLRRWRYPKPYAYLMRNLIGDDDLLVQNPEELNMFAIRENGVSDRKNSDNELAICLRENAYNESRCVGHWHVHSGSLVGSEDFRRFETLRGQAFNIFSYIYNYWPHTTVWILCANLCALLLVPDFMTKLRVALKKQRASELVYWILFRRCRGIKLCAFALVIYCIVNLFFFTTVNVCIIGDELSVSKDLSGFSSMQCPTIRNFWNFFGLLSIFQQNSDRVYISSPIYVNNLSLVILIRSIADRSFLNYAYKNDSAGRSWIYGGTTFVVPYIIQSPCIFLFEEKWYMLPASTSIPYATIYSSDSLMTDWSPFRNLVFTPEPSTAKLYRHSNTIWYLVITTIADPPRNSFWQAPFLHGPFVAMLVNQNDNHPLPVAIELSEPLCRTPTI